VRKFNRCVAIVLVVLLIGMTFDGGETSAEADKKLY